MGGEIFRTRLDRPWSPPSLLYNGRVVAGGKGPGRGVNHPPLSSAEVKERVGLYFFSSLGLRGLFLGDLYLYQWGLGRAEKRFFLRAEGSTNYNTSRAGFRRSLLRFFPRGASYV